MLVFTAFDLTKMTNISLSNSLAIEVGIRSEALEFNIFLGGSYLVSLISSCIKMISNSYLSKTGRT